MRKTNNNIDMLTFALIVIIAGFGVVMVYSASNYYALVNFGDPFNLVKKQLMFVIIGVVAMLYIANNIDYKLFCNLKVTAVFYILSICLVALLPFIGHESNGATRWIRIGPISIQPSEFVKIAVILTLSAYIVEYRNKLHDLRYLFVAGLIILVPATFVLVENMSSALVIIAAGGLILFVSTPQVWYYILAVGGVFGMGSLAMWLANNTTEEAGGLIGLIFPQYRLNRFRVWKDPWIDPRGVGYQPIQSLYAIGSGGLFGRGLGMSIQKQGFLPEPHNDIIFSVICEELGLVGASIVLLTYGILIFRGLSIAVKADDLFGSLVATGLVGLIGVQVLINVAVNTNTLPNTGMQLPLISYGGTAVVVLLASMGILLNISKTAKVKKPAK
ncbi:MAG: hypothetical protein ATN35_07205 [Epulopiscium sp. Nele67-Bin004]|nr:MAG: hypothetical protein ATN35_07205 [Epulopiscium sp. Nele67-Bin004]